MGRRKIIHVDMDAFYAFAEQRDHPELRDKPLATGHAEERGAVATASYEARRYGACSAMSSQKAKRLYPQLIFIPRRTNIYKSVSCRVYKIFHRYTDLIEPLSLDGAFPDVAENKQGTLLAIGITRIIEQRIREGLNLVASVGVPYNKFLAKIAPDPRKPDGFCTTHPNQALDFVTRLSIESLWGVGPVTAWKMHLLGIHNDPQSRGCSSEVLAQQFGKVGLFYYDFARGIDLRSVEAVWIRKSVGCKHTLEKDIHTKSAATIELYHTATELVKRLQRKDFRGKTPTLKIKLHDFSRIIRSMTQTQELMSLERVLPLIEQLLKEVEYEQYPIRLIGLSMSNPREKTDEHQGVWEQLSFEFSDWGK